MGILDQLVQRFLLALQKWGGVVAITIDISTQRSLIVQNPQYRLRHRDLDFSNWVQKLFWRIDFARRIPANISVLFKRCFPVVITSWHGTTLNQPLNNVVYIVLGIYNVKQLQINVVYFNDFMGYVEKSLPFWTSRLKTLGNVKTTDWIWPFRKSFKTEYPEVKVLTTIP